MIDIILEALKKYLSKKEAKDEIVRKMISTGVALDSEEFERRVREVEEALSEWKVSSV